MRCPKHTASSSPGFGSILPGPRGPYDRPKALLERHQNLKMSFDSAGHGGTGGTSLHRDRVVIFCSGAGGRNREFGRKAGISKSGTLPEDAALQLLSFYLGKFRYEQTEPLDLPIFTEL